MAFAEGQLGAEDVPSGVLTEVYTVPVRKRAKVTITISNRTDTTTNIRLALIRAGGVAIVSNKDYVIFDLPTSALASNLAPIEFSGVPLGSGDTVAVYSSANDVTAQVSGTEADI